MRSSSLHAITSEFNHVDGLYYLFERYNQEKKMKNQSFKNWLVLTLLCGAVSLVGCSEDKKSSSGSSDSAISSAVTTVGSKLSSTAALLDTNSSSSLGVGAFAVGIDSVWTTANGVFDLSNSGRSTLKDWFQDEFNPSFENSNGARVTFAGRIANALQIFCFLGEGGLATDSTNLPTDGTHSMTLTAQMATDCGADSGGDVTGATVSMTVTTLSDTTIYDKSFSVALPGSENCPFLFNARINSSEINIATSEDQSCDGRDQASLSVVRYNIANQTFRFTYISQAFNISSSGGFEFYRGYLNESSDEAYVLGIYGGDNGTSLENYVSFTASGKPTAGGTVAFSVQTDDQSGSGGLSAGDYNGCISAADGSVATDNTLACSVTGTQISTGQSTITSARAANSARSDIYSIDASTDVGFTDNSDMF